MAFNDVSELRIRQVRSKIKALYDDLGEAFLPTSGSYLDNFKTKHAYETAREDSLEFPEKYYYFRSWNVEVFPRFMKQSETYSLKWTNFEPDNVFFHSEIQPTLRISRPNFFIDNLNYNECLMYFNDVVLAVIKAFERQTVALELF